MRTSLHFVTDNRRCASAMQHPELPVFMHPVEFAQLSGIAQALAPRRVLEWGSGGSTAALLHLGATIEEYVAIENNREWFERVRGLVRDPRLSLHHVPAAAAEPVIPARASRRKRTAILKAWFALCESDAAMMADYVAYPRTLGGQFELILVDGRARNACLREALSLLSPHGAIVIHDAQRPEYRETIESLSGHLFLDPWVQGQLCVIRPS